VIDGIDINRFSAAVNSNGLCYSSGSSILIP
jgi:hypothetical protein